MKAPRGTCVMCQRDVPLTKHGWPRAHKTTEGQKCHSVNILPGSRREAEEDKP